MRKISFLNKNIFIILFFILLSSCSVIKNQQSTNNLRSHVEYLASDKLEGRYPCTKGDSLAADYIRSEFLKNGLSPLSQNGFQYFDIISSISLGEDNSLVFKNKTYKVNIDYVPLSFGKNTVLSSEIFFAGYGFIIDSDSLYWNDYKDNDIKDKWVMILRGSPEGDNPHSVYSEHLSLRKKVLNAKDNSAAGVIFVSGENFDNDDSLISLSYDQSQQDLGIPIIHIKRDLANQILETRNISIQVLETKIDQDFKDGKTVYAENPLDAPLSITISMILNHYYPCN